MSKKVFNSFIIIGSILLLLLSAGALRHMPEEGSPRRATLVLAVYLVWTLAVIAGLILGLKHSLNRTLYSYTNVGLIGGILFSGVLAAILLYYLVLCLSRGQELSSAELFSVLTEYPRRFSYFAVSLIGAVCIAVCVSNLSLIRHEGLCPANLLGVLLSVFFLGGTVAVFVLSAALDRRFGAGTATVRVINMSVSMFLLTMLSYFECVFIGTCVMGWLTSRHIPTYDKDFVIVLGCSIDKRGGLLPLLKGRVNRAVRFAWEQEIATGKPCRYIPSGGQGANEVMSEGSAMELYLLSHGAEEDEVFPEKKSVNTLENMLFSKRVADSLQPGAKFAFATTNYHIFRSGILARQAGLDAEGIASDTKWYFWPNGFVREFFAILAMNKKTHVGFAAVAAAICAAVGGITYFLGIG